MVIFPGCNMTPIQIDLEKQNQIKKKSQAERYNEIYS